MPFEPKAQLRETKAQPFPVLETSQRLRLEEELRSIHQQMNSLVNAITEISTYLKQNT